MHSTNGISKSNSTDYNRSIESDKIMRYEDSRSLSPNYKSEIFILHVAIGVLGCFLLTIMTVVVFRYVRAKRGEAKKDKVKRKKRELRTSDTLFDIPTIDPMIHSPSSIKPCCPVEEDVYADSYHRCKGSTDASSGSTTTTRTQTIRSERALTKNDENTKMSDVRSAVDSVSSGTALTGGSDAGGANSSIFSPQHGFLPMIHSSPRGSQVSKNIHSVSARQYPSGLNPDRVLLTSFTMDTNAL